MFDPVTLSLNVDPLILSALKEDITSEDVSTNSVMPESRLGTADLICKDEGVICGLQVFARTFALLDPDTKVTFDVSEGDVVTKGQHLATVTGGIRVILSGERTALNYLQRMSGVATCARQMSKLLEETGIRLLDTRKTTPNNRIFQKYAVRVGGGYNHRYNLTDGVMLKDNHIGAAGGVNQAIQAAKEYAPFVRKIEVETENGTAQGMVYLMNRGQISPPSDGYLQTIWDGYKANGMDTSYLLEAAARAYDYASDMNIKYDESFDEDEDLGLDDDIQMSFKF